MSESTKPAHLDHDALTFDPGADADPTKMPEKAQGAASEHDDDDDKRDDEEKTGTQSRRRTSS